MAREVAIGGSGSLFVGEDKILRIEILDVANLPVDLTGMDIVFDVRKKDNAPDPAIFSLSTVITGVYASTRSANTQRAVAVLTDTQMNTISAKTYRHSWKRMDDGSETVLAYGDFIVEKATAP